MGRANSRRSKKLPAKVSRKPVVKQPTPVPSNNTPGIGSTIGQGIGIGAGAAMGNMMINGMVNTISGNSEDSNKNEVQNYSSCNYILESFQNCMYSHNDTVLCKPQLELFNKCVAKNGNEFQ